MDCGFTACMFTPSEIGALQRNGVRVAFICGAAIDIGPKLKSWNCFPLFQLQSENVLESKTIDELNDKFNKKMDSYFVNQPGIFPECAECKYYKRNQCQGGCKSFKSSNA
jgi:radical SAM protein with 4Fe4S-binding SPASM domain